MTGVFINYRTGDANQVAAFIERELVQMFGEEQVFLDSTSLPAGRPFPQELKRRLTDSTVLLVLIGPNWLTLSDANGRRIDNPDDYVRYEIELSLKRQITVLPLLLDDTVLPKPRDLPPQIVDLVIHQYRRIRSREQGRDMDELVTFLRGHLPAVRKSSRADAREDSPSSTIKAKAGKGIISFGPDAKNQYNDHSGGTA